MCITVQRFLNLFVLLSGSDRSVGTQYFTCCEGANISLNLFVCVCERDLFEQVAQEKSRWIDTHFLNMFGLTV